MEKQAKSKQNKILKFLPKATSAVYFQNPPFSPSRDRRSDNNHFHRFKSHVGNGKGFSGPIVSIIPDEVRRKPKNGSFETQEPTSPKVSCMGQIKHKKIKMVSSKPNKGTSSAPQETKPVDIKKTKSTIKRLFSNVKVSGGRRSDASIYDKQPLSADRAPSLSQMKRFASGRDTFANFDWTDQITPAGADHRDYYSDEDDDRIYNDQEEEEMIIPFSAPIIVCPGKDLQPRKEVNLWKRRTMNPPKPLQLNLSIRTT